MNNEPELYNKIVLIKILINNSNFIIKLTSFLIILSTIYFLISPKFYKTNVSFYINEQNNNQTFGNYAKLLGFSSSSSLESKLLTLLNSLRLKHLVSNYVFDDVLKYYELEFNDDQIKTDKLNIIISYLDLKDNIILNNTDGLYQLSFEHPQPEISYKVIEAYINALYSINIELELSTQKNIITVLDEPVLAKVHSRPKLIINIIIGLVTGFLLSTIIITSKYFYLNVKEVWNSPT